MSTALYPTLHKPIPMDTLVVIPPGLYSTKPLTGRVIGIASIHIIFFYIILLDTPIDSEYGRQSAISVQGTFLEAPDGSNWRLDK